MISKSQFNTIKPGDYLKFESGNIRKVLGIGNNSITFSMIRPRHGNTTTVYTYSDIYKKVVGIFDSELLAGQVGILHDTPDYTNILKIIKRIKDSFPNAVEVYTSGSCVKFAMILKQIYPKGLILYDLNHAIFELGGTCYDIGGIAKKGSHIPIEEYGTLQAYDSMNLIFNKM